MNDLLNNLIELVKMIFGVIVTPNYGSDDVRYNILRWLYDSNTSFADVGRTRAILFLTFGIFLIGGCIGIVKRFLWKN